ncbi:FAD-dependent monooxygenase [Myroides sp. LJL115]
MNPTTQNNSKVAIIGAGIAGLTMALALKKQNIDFVIYESAKKLKPVGAGIALAANAMQIFNYFGISEKLKQSGVRMLQVELSDFNLNRLSTNDLLSFENKFKALNIAIHRRELHRILVEEIGIENILLDKRLACVKQENTQGYTLIMQEGSNFTHSIVIGADGLRSKVRDFVHPNSKIRNAKQVCYRGVVDFNLPNELDNTSLEAWGSGKRFGFVKINDNQVYWYFLINENLKKASTTLFNYLEECPDMVRELIQKTPSENIFEDNIYDLEPINNWVKGGVCLIGDAAHATTPNLGQGACQGIEDAYVISLLLEKYDLLTALEKYPSLRREKAHKVVKQSWNLGKVAQLESVLWGNMRNAAFQLLPEYLANKQMNWLFDIHKYKEEINKL